jgi:type VI secretion system secreted protein VgrG
MPTLPLEARVLVQGEEVTLGSLRWELRLTGHYRVRDQAGSGYRLQAYALPAGHARSKPGERVHFELAPGALVGGALEIKAVFHGGAELGGLTASKKRAGCRVLGKDPPRHEVEAFISARGGSLAWLYLRMFCHESNHQLAQFAQGSGGGNTPGFPLYGPPSGVGIVQRDPTAGEWRFPRGPIGHENNFFPRIFWDWKHNVTEGITSFHSDYLERGRRDLDLLRQGHPHLQMYPEGLLLRAAIRRYNGGTEFAASADGRHYVVSPAYTNNPGYVDDVLDDPHIHGHAVPAEARARKWP